MASAPTSPSRSVVYEKENGRDSDRGRDGYRAGGSAPGPLKAGWHGQSDADIGIAAYGRRNDSGRHANREVDGGALSGGARGKEGSLRPPADGRPSMFDERANQKSNQNPNHNQNQNQPLLRHSDRDLDQQSLRPPLAKQSTPSYSSSSFSSSQLGRARSLSPFGNPPAAATTATRPGTDRERVNQTPLSSSLNAPLSQLDEYNPPNKNSSSNSKSKKTNASSASVTDSDSLSVHSDTSLLLAGSDPEAVIGGIAGRFNRLQKLYERVTGRNPIAGSRHSSASASVAVNSRGNSRSRSSSRRSTSRFEDDSDDDSL